MSIVVLDSSPCRIWYRVPEADLKMALVSIQGLGGFSMKMGSLDWPSGQARKGF